MNHRTAWIFWSCLCCVFLVPVFSANAAEEKHDLTYVVPNASYVICSRPSEHFKNPAIATAYEGLKKAFAQDIAMLDVVAKMDLFKTSGIASHVEHAEPKDFAVVAHMHFMDAAATQGYMDIESKGKKRTEHPDSKYPIYLRAQRSGKNFDELKHCDAMAQTGPQSVTIVIPYGEFFKTIAPPSPPPEPSWAANFQKFSQSQSLIFIEMVEFRKLMNTALERENSILATSAPFLQNLKPLWNDCDLTFISLDTSSGFVLQLQAESASPEAARRYLVTLTTLLEAVKKFLPTAKEPLMQLNRVQHGLGDDLNKEVTSLLAAIQITSSETTTKLTLRMDQETLGRTAKLALPLIELAFAPKSPTP